MTTVSNIVKDGLCLGCGLCEAVNANCKMSIGKDGFYKPNISSLSAGDEKKINALCPGIKINNKGGRNTEIWGNVVAVSNAWASDKEIRNSSSSGGVTSALAIYLLESKKVDAVLHVGNVKEDYLHNELFVSRTREDVLQRNASRYAPALVFNRIFDILEKHKDEKFCFIGKPCDVAAVRNILQEYPQYKKRIPYCLAIFCAGMPSYNATLKAISTFGNPSTPVSLRYRGEGWPGYFTVKHEDGTVDRMTYNDSWGKILGRELGFRCKICPDGIGLLADISSGDSWNTKNGYPDFTEAEGRNFCFIRTTEGKQLFDDAYNAGYIQKENLDVEEVKNMQRYQYQRRHLVGWRIAAVQLLSGGILKFNGLGCYSMALKTDSYKSALRDALGTCKRFLKARKNG